MHSVFYGDFFLPSTFDTNIIYFGKTDAKFSHSKFFAKKLFHLH